MCFGVYFDQILSIFKYIQFMIVTAHLLCGGGGAWWWRYLYHNNTAASFARFGGMLPQENLEKIVSFGALFSYIWIIFSLT